MTRDDLLKLLDLGGKEVARAGDELTVAPAAAVGPDPAAGPTVLDVDTWGLRRGRDQVAESDRLKKSGTDEHAAADFFCAAFDPDPRLLESCADPRRREFVTQLLDTPEYHALHAVIRHLPSAAGLIPTYVAGSAKLSVIGSPPFSHGGYVDRSAAEPSSTLCV